MNININHIYFHFVFVLFMYSWLLLSRVYRPHHLQLCYLLFISCFFNISIIRFIMSSFPHWYNSIFHTLHAPRTTWRIHNPRAQPRPPRASFFPGSPSPSSRVTWLGAEVSYGVKASKPGYSITPDAGHSRLSSRLFPCLYAPLA